MNEKDRKTDLRVYVLAKNEDANIARCLDAISSQGLHATVLDSGSSDRTVDIVSTYPKIAMVPYNYRNHCVAYNEICTDTLDGCTYVMILDADMVVSAELFEEIYNLTRDGLWDVIKVPVLMFVEGKAMRCGSLYPPKAVVFKTGRAYFTPSGHGETLIEDCRVTRTNCNLVHDDRKGYEAYLMSQVRYARSLLLRRDSGTASLKDMLRLNTPLMMFIVPVCSYFLKLGFLCGKTGLIYAMDRLIAEAIMFRQSLAERV